MALGNVSTTVAMTSIASSFDKLYPLLGARLRALMFWTESLAYLLSQNLCPGVGNRHRVLKMSTHASIIGHGRPAIAQYAHIRLAGIHHGLNRNYHARPQLHACTRFAK